jgi:hypothetical protein
LKTSALALLGVVTAFEYDYSIPFANTDNCGQCLRGGNVFCVNGLDATRVAYDSASGPATRCCRQGATCLETSNVNWSCSDTYESPAYAMTMCPQIASKCGDTSITFDGRPQEASVEVNGLNFGESCTYRVKATCGAPSFEIDADSTIDHDRVLITYAEFNSNNIDDANISTLTTLIADRDDMTYANGLPPRNQFYQDMLNQDFYENQGRPRRARAGDGAVIEGSQLGVEPTELGDLGTEMWSESDLQTEAVAGFGMPTVGSYSVTERGWKSFGTIGQGDDSKGLRDYGS